MGKKKKPKTVKFPGPTETEKQIQQLQLQLMQQQIAQGQESYAQQKADRTQMLDALNKLTNGRPLTAEETALVNDLGNQYTDNLMRGIESGIVGQQLDRNRADAIGELAARGVLSSSTGAQVLGGLEKERARLIADAQQQGALTKLNLQREFMLNATNAELAKSQILSGTNAQLLNYANQATANAGSLGNSVAGQQWNQRIGQYNSDVQNAQQQYMYGGNGKAALGSAIGAGIGGLLAIPTGGMSILGGAAIGSTLGGIGGSYLR